MQSVADRLIEERQAKGLSLTEVSTKTKIPKNQLKYIENGNWSAFSSYAYLQGVIKKYGHLLGLSEKKLLPLLRREVKTQPYSIVRDSNYEEKNKINSKLMFFLIVFLLLIIFFISQLWVFWQKPKVQLQTIPVTIKREKPLQIKGQTESGSLIYLNDEQIFLNEKGQFNQSLFLKEGKHEFILKIIGPNGKEYVRKFTVKVK